MGFSALLGVLKRCDLFQSSPWKIRRLSLARCRAQLSTPACVGVSSGGAWSDVVMRCRLESSITSPRHCHILSSNCSSLPSSVSDLRRSYVDLISPCFQLLVHCSVVPLSPVQLLTAA